MYSAEEMGQDQLALSPDGRGFINVSGVSTKLSTYLPHLIPEQFTGLKDKNSKEGYRADTVIVKKHYPDTVFEILWDERWGRFLLQATGSNLRVDMGYFINEGEIIGTIHDKENHD